MLLGNMFDAISERCGGVMLLDGSRGDQLFQARGERPIHLYGALHDACYLEFLRDITQVALNQGNTVWHLLKEACQSLWSKSSWPWYSSKWDVPSWLRHDPSKEVISDQKPPYWKEVMLMNPAKVMHALEIYDWSGQADRYSRCKHRICEHPLMALPVVEEILWWPRQDLCDAATDRIRMRNDFKSRLPEEVTARKTKGEHTGVLLTGLKAELPFCLELLREGWLMKNNMIQWDLLESDMEAAVQGFSKQMWPILNVIAVEMWIISLNLK